MKLNIEVERYIKEHMEDMLDRGFKVKIPLMGFGMGNAPQTLNTCRKSSIWPLRSGFKGILPSAKPKI